MKVPMTFFGSKAKPAPLIWQAFGQLQTYVEPFAGSLAVLLACPLELLPAQEVISDTDGMICNFWRAVKANPRAVADFMSSRVDHFDLIAWRETIKKEERDVFCRLTKDRSWFDAEMAGRWAWVQNESVAGLSSGKKGVPRARPHKKRLKRDFLPAVSAISKRLEFTTTLCADWKTCVSDTRLSQTKTWVNKGYIAGVFLDPPYDLQYRSPGLYPHEGPKTPKEVRQWCLENGNRNNLRIILAGLSDEGGPDGWTSVNWTTSRSFGAKCSGKEMLWFSPSCLSGSGGTP